MAVKKYTWHKVAEAEGEILWGANGIAVVEAKGKKVCVVRHLGGWYGFAYKCPHASGIMADGFVDALGNIVCPVHRYRFSLQNGRNTSGEGYYLKTYPVEVRVEGVFVGLEEGGLLGWL